MKKWVSRNPSCSICTANFKVFLVWNFGSWYREETYSVCWKIECVESARIPAQIMNFRITNHMYISDDDILAVLHPFQQYYRHIRMMGHWLWKALCNEVPFKLGQNTTIAGHKIEVMSANLLALQTLRNITVKPDDISAKTTISISI